MSQHRADDDDGDDGVDGTPRDLGYGPSVHDRLVYWRYTLSPTTYVDEGSTSSDLLWQLVLEERAVRHWLIVLWVTLILGITTLAVLLLMTTSS